MKIIPISQITKIACLALAAIGLTAVSAHAQTVLGSFQGSGDPLNAGWIDPQNSNDPITADPAASFVAAGVPTYSLSLDMSAAGHAGSFGYPSLQLQFSPAQIAAFNANSWITFTFSVPAATAGGYSQIYNLALNAPGYGYNNLSWATVQETGNTGADTAGSFPNFYFYNGSPLQTQVVTVNYSSVLAAIEAGGEGYLQMTFQGNQGGGAPTDMYFNNVVLSTGAFGVDVPEPTSLALLGGSLMALVVIRRRQKA
jgi:hypothetical protein